MGQTTAKAITLRMASVDDVNILVELWQELMNFHAARDSYYTCKPDAAELAVKYFEARIVDEKVTVLVAEVDGKVIGFLMAEPSSRPPVFEEKSTLMITDTCVNSDYRRLGIGEAMVDELIRIAREQNIKRIEVSYSVENEVSTAFWKKIGFKPFLVKASMELV